MKFKFLLVVSTCLSIAGRAQLNIQSGATFFIQSGATVTVQGDLTSATDVQGPGTVLMNGTSLQNLNLNGFTVQNLQISNSNNVSLTGAVRVGTSFLFTTGKVLLNGFNLKLVDVATLTGFDNTKYFVTNGAGKLIKNALGNVAFVFPVGADVSTYNPLTLTQNGTADSLGVRCFANVLKNGTSGAAMVKEVADASWEVTETNAGGNNLNMTASWATTDELPGFNHTKTGISFFDGTGWDMTNAMLGAASGSNPFTISRNSITNLGVFAVGFRPVLITLLVAPKVFLQAAFAGGGLMNDNLRAAGVIPLSEPYSAISGFTQSGSGGGETIPSSILSSTGTGVDIVDWAFAQLHRSSDGAVIATRSVLLQRDGNVVDVDGTNTKTAFINFAGTPDDVSNFFVSIRHRNHLGVRSSSLIDLSRTSSPTYDFTTSLASAFSVGITNNPMASLSGGVFGMWGGNVNGNTNVRYSGPSNDNGFLLNTILGGNKAAVISGYSVGDLNMNGVTRYSGPSNDNGFLLNTILGGNKALVISQPSF